MTDLKNFPHPKLHTTLFTYPKYMSNPYTFHTPNNMKEYNEVPRNKTVYLSH